MIFTVGATSSTLHTPTAQAGGEVRRAVCWYANHLYYYLFACAAHLENSNMPIASAQLTSIVQWMATVSGSYIAVLGGDLNMDTQWNRPNYWNVCATLTSAPGCSGWNALVWPAGYVEADTLAQPLPLSTRVTTDSNNKYDYIWIEAAYTPSQRARFTLMWWSDHHMYEMML